MKTKISLFLELLLSSWALGGCAIHPLPEDVASLDTYAIAMQIRCEARAAIIREAYEYINYPKKIVEIPIMKQQNILKVADIISASNNIPKEKLDTLNKYKRAAIALEFSFNITEDNNINPSTGLLSTFLGGSDAVLFSALDNHGRRNFRNFRITENWGDLVNDGAKGCEHYNPASDNYNYPITGSIGIFEIISSYARINEKTTLSASKSDKDDSAFVDDLTFTTMISGSIMPTHTLKPPAGRSLIQNSATGTALADRTDQHELVIALYIPKTVADKKTGGGNARPQEVVNSAADRQASKRFLFGVDPLSTLQGLTSGR